MATQYTRQEFYDLVWSQPVTQVAKQFAISDVAIHKICKKHGIPTPPPGWWAKKNAGKAARQIPLPKAAGHQTDRITMPEGNLMREQSAASDARTEARTLAAMEPYVRAEADHPIIAKTLSSLGKAKPDDLGFVSVSGGTVIKCKVAAASVPRLESFLFDVVGAALQQGFWLVAGDGAAKFRSDRESLSFEITEELERFPHEMTPKEKAELEAWEKKKLAASRRNAWDGLFWSKPKFPDWDYRPSGKLGIELEQVYVRDGASSRRSFRDTKTRRIEDLVPDIAVGLAVLAAVKGNERIRAEEARLKAEEERRQREIQAKKQYIAKRRDAAVEQMMDELAELDTLRRLVNLISDNLSDDQAPRVSQLVNHAKSSLAAREAKFKGDQLERRLGQSHLFGDDDDFDFRYQGW